MLTADPRKHLKRGTKDRRCWECASWVEPDKWPDAAQPLGDCTRVRWEHAGHRQMTHADDVCAKFSAGFGRSTEEREERVLVAGLG